MSQIEVWPAVDLLEGRPTRLYQGAFDHATAYAKTREQLFRQLRAAGSPRLHLVDLSGAKTGLFSAWEALAEAVEVGLDVEVGGGFRDIASIGRAFSEGARYVVVGTHLITHPAFANAVAKTFGGRQIVAGIDVLAGQARIRGWTEAGADAKSLWQDLYRQGFRRLNVTDIEQDGSLAGIRGEFWQEWMQMPGNLCAGGGVRSLADLRALEALGVPRVVVGKAWLEGLIDLASISWEGL